MIWNVQRESEGAEWLAAYVEEELAGAAPERPDAAREVAGAVEAFIRDRHPNQALAAEYLLLLIARALWAIGEEAAARRFIGARGAEWRVAPAFAGAATAPDLSVPHWHALLGSRTVQSSSSLARGAIWIVDIRRLLDPGRDGLELTVFRALNAVLDQLGGVWDGTRGQGILGLKRLDDAASAVLDCRRRCRKSVALAQDIRRQCELRLRSMKQGRGWTAIPEVIGL